MNKQPPLVTRNSLKDMIFAAKAANDWDKVGRIVGRALVVLYQRQTASEQRRNDTEELNNEGFAASDAKEGSIAAKYFLKHGRLERWMIDKWLEYQKGAPRICKYSRQLNEAALLKKNP